MDPYLEAPDIWPDFHDAFAGSMRGQINARLPEPYYCRLQVRAETGVEVRIHTDPIRHPFLEIRDAARGHKIITVIEIVSPSSKRPGPDRRAYEAKQQEILESDASLIEIDLLREGRRLLPYPDLEQAAHALGCDYLVILNRAARRSGTWMDYTLYPVDIREMLPCIPVPLAGEDPDVLLDLQVAQRDAYLSGPYLRAVDYTAPPQPRLSVDDETWADAVLRTARLRAAPVS